MAAGSRKQCFYRTLVQFRAHLSSQGLNRQRGRNIYYLDVIVGSGLTGDYVTEVDDPAFVSYSSLLPVHHTLSGRPIRECVKYQRSNCL